MDKPKVLTDQLAEIRVGVREGIRGTVMLKWVWLLDVHRLVRRRDTFALVLVGEQSRSVVR